MKKDKAMQLVKTLRSGTYQQNYLRLVDENDCFCVMGVVCNESKADLEWEQRFNIWYIGNEFFQLPKKIQKEYGFHSPAGSRVDGNELVIGGQGYESLMDANDNGVSFEDLADYIEKNYKYL
jgi:hypothetical protein